MPKKIKKSSKSTNLLSPMFALLIVLSIVVMILTALLIDLYNRQKSSDIANIRYLIVSAMEDLSQKPTASADNKALIPESNVSFTYSNDLRYTYADSTSIEINSNDTRQTAIYDITGSTIDEIFAKVPQAQACSKQILISLDDSDIPAEYKLETSKKLQDGRLAKIHSSTVCKDNLTALLETAKTIESY